MKLYVSRQRNGMYMYTYRKPIFTEVGGTQEIDSYVEPGEPVGYRNICKYMTRALFGIEDLPLGEVVRVKLEGQVLAPPQKLEENS